MGGQEDRHDSLFPSFSAPHPQSQAHAQTSGRFSGKSGSLEPSTRCEVTRWFLALISVTQGEMHEAALHWRLICKGGAGHGAPHA